MGNLPLTIFMVLAVLILSFYVGTKLAIRGVIKARLEDVRKKYPDGYKSERISFLQHEGHRILLLDLTYCATEEAIESMKRYRHLVSAQSPNSLLTVIDVTDGQFSLEAVEQLKLVILQNRPYVARAAFVGVYRTSDHRIPASLPRKKNRPFLHTSVGLPNFDTRDDAIDFVEHDDEYGIYHREYKPGTLTKDGNYNWALLWELLARLLTYPDDQYWTTVQRCLPFFTYARTRAARLMTSFADDIKDLSLEQLQSLYIEAFNRNPAWSLELGRLLHLDDRKRADMISWIEARTGQIPSSRAAPICQQTATHPWWKLHVPYDHISVALLLMTVPRSSYWDEISSRWVLPAMENLAIAMKDSKSPFEKLVKVVAITHSFG